MNTAKNYNSSVQNPAEKHKIIKHLEILRISILKKLVILYFRWALHSSSAAQYCRSNWNATQCMKERNFCLLDMDTIQ